MIPRVLVIGADGFVGSALVDGFRSEGIPVVSTSRKPQAIKGEVSFLDLGQDVSHWAPFSGVSVAILCAAVSSTEACRRDPLGTRLVNVENTLGVAEKLSKLGIFVVFLSSNQVFDGTVPFAPPHLSVCPVMEYGRQKVDTERGVLALGDRAAVLRMSKVFAPRSGLLAMWADTLRSGGVIHPFSDLTLSPIPVSFVVEVLRRLVDSPSPGLWQISGSADVPYEQAARHVGRRLGISDVHIQSLEARQARPDIEAVPRFSSLDSSRVQSEFGLSAPDVWQTVSLAAGV